MTLLLAAVIFLLLRFLASFSSIRRLLLPALGAVAVCALPVGFLLVRGVLLHNATEGVLLFFETIGAIVCVIMWVLPSRKLPTFVGGFLLVLHFLIWAVACHFLVGLTDAYRSSGLAAILFRWAPLNLIIPTLGFVSSATWARYVTSLTEEPPDTAK